MLFRKDSYTKPAVQAYKRALEATLIPVILGEKRDSVHSPLSNSCFFVICGILAFLMCTGHCTAIMCE